MRFIINKVGLLVILLSLSGFCQSIKKDTPKTVLLILGSADLNTTISRVEIGFNLYTSEINFDYVVVSGGCGAHSSSICEATVMADLLIEKGVSENIIFKEEKSKSTAQNYCYSRELVNPDGARIINEGDTLFVVSNHWHAMSVSGCFNDKDLINSKYVIEGSIIPKKDDKTDYVAIYENCMNNSNYCKSVLWPKVDAAYSMKSFHEKYDQEARNLFIRDLIIKSQDSNNVYSVISIELPQLPRLWKSNINASFYNKFENLIYLFKDDQFIAIKPGSSRIKKGYPKSLSNLFSNLSNYWQKGHVDAAFFHPKTKQIYFFKGDQYVQLQYKKNKIQIAESPKGISELILNWSFKWGKGNIDAALFIESTNELLLYRGQEMLKLNFDGENLNVFKNMPEKISLDWPKELWGCRN
ncbi:ElyC/SanA/YdcF family protein [Gelidibacter salicanalis]|uniref:YdcF family protein n=1 Tax=Gelidibacter salicanalis TaxID=291193 RepID=A0A934KWB1_9FLAO|nr:ElyC/SanA/YdcF family protein [Gelidibacter salicanalis]MBJ7882476.1 YdcF family protein [Gelidibacter salicanalis]